MRPQRVIRSALWALAVLGLSSCIFSPNLGDGQVRCGPSNECPPGQACVAGDGFCHKVVPSPNGTCIPVHCFVGWCGPVSDGCGKTIDCGPCNPGPTDGGVPADMTGCKSTRRCTTGLSCGYIDDGCGNQLDCGECALPHACSNTTPNQCTCTPKSCADVGATCGHYPDGCGTILNCFPDMGMACEMGTGFCGGGGPYVCGKVGGCNPLPGCPPGACGQIPDGCRGTLRCGNCPAGQICGGGGKPNVCA
jgi:hypothetical protein